MTMFGIRQKKAMVSRRKVSIIVRNDETLPRIDEIRAVAGNRKVWPSNIVDVCKPNFFYS